MHRAVRQNEHHVRAAGSALLPLHKLELTQVRNKIRFPHVPAGCLGDEFPLAGKERLLTLSVREDERILENEGFVVE